MNKMSRSNKQQIEAKLDNEFYAIKTMIQETKNGALFAQAKSNKNKKSANFVIFFSLFLATIQWQFIFDINLIRRSEAAKLPNIYWNSSNPM